MHFSRLVFAGVLLATDALAVPTVPRTPHEKRHESATKWVKRDRLDERQILPMRIGLKQSNLEHGHDLLMDISHPESPNYSNWLSGDEIVDLFAPAQDSVDMVREWLHSAGIHAERISQSANKQWIQFDAHVAEAERLLNTKYHFYEHNKGKVGVACDEYHLPDHLSDHIDYVTPGVKLMTTVKPARQPREKRGFLDANGKFSGPVIIGQIEKALFGDFKDKTLLGLCDTLVTPPCIARAYNITPPTKAAKGNEIGIFEEGDTYAAQDLAEFFTLFAPQIPPTTFPTLHAIDGATAPAATDATSESDLDFEIAYPIVYPQQAILFQTDDIFYSTIGVGTNSSGFLNTFLDAIDGSYCKYDGGDDPIDPKYPDPNPLGYQGKTMCGVYKPTNVISISYGEQEDDLPTHYQTRQCNEFMKLAMQGTTVFVASGDSGVAARGTDDGNSDGCLGSGADAGKVFNPDFPTSCPYLVSVGATLLNGDVNKDQEVAVQRFPSGGGFSNVYKQPSWQSKAVNTYLTQHTPSYKSYALTTSTNNPTSAQTKGGIYNRAGRGYPDMSAIGDNVVIVSNGAPTLVGGTSASAPIVASMFNRVNEERLAVGKKPVGFILPTIYANPWIFNDIVSGNNSGCGTPGFYAAKGWDPVTGLGSPNYPAVLKLFMGLK